MDEGDAERPEIANDGRCIRRLLEDHRDGAVGIEYIDLVVPGFIEFEYEDEHLLGQFQFGAVAGWLDCRPRQIEGEPYIEWSWEGHNDSDPACGRGWATLRGNSLAGHLFIHAGDHSTFEAVKQLRPCRRQRRR